ncbi:MAG: hypothetical protein ACRDB0_05125 [Paraclostridium sp.]
MKYRIYLVKAYKIGGTVIVEETKDTVDCIKHYMHDKYKNTNNLYDMHIDPIGYTDEIPCLYSIYGGGYEEVQMKNIIGYANITGME